jgi:hypothetical protein
LPSRVIRVWHSTKPNSNISITSSTPFISLRALSSTVVGPRVA